MRSPKKLLLDKFQFQIVVLSAGRPFSKPSAIPITAGQNSLSFGYQCPWCAELLAGNSVGAAEKDLLTTIAL